VFIVIIFLNRLDCGCDGRFLDWDLDMLNKPGYVRPWKIFIECDLRSADGGHDSRVDGLLFDEQSVDNGSIADNVIIQRGSC